jgi:fructokinase
VTPLRPVLCGEILFDTWADGSAVLGGAPVNVAVHLAGLGERPLLIGRVAADPAGERARATLAGWGVDTAGVQVDDTAPTGEVRVRVESGEPSYEIVPGSAWDALDAGEATAALAAAGPAILYHGVLAARGECGRDALERLRGAVPQAVFVDVNLRPPWTPLARALALARGASWIKVNETELALLGERAAPAGAAGRAADARSLAVATGAGRIAVTLGERGAELYSAAGRLAEVPAVPLAPAAAVDPVGAGDAFAAVLLLGLQRDWPEPLALERAAELAAAVCALRGALPEDAGFHRSFRRAWGLM